MHDIFATPLAAHQFRLSDFRLTRFILSPDQWRGCALPVALTWHTVQFSQTNVSAIPDDRVGVYSFVVKPGIANHPECAYLLYVGMVESQDFRERYKQYLHEKAQGAKSRRPHVTDMLLKWEGFLSFCYAPIASTTAIKGVEDALLAAYLPPSNKDFPASISRAHRQVFEH